MAAALVALNLMLLWLDIVLGHHLRLKLVNLRIQNTGRLSAIVLVVANGAGCLLPSIL